MLERVGLKPTADLTRFLTTEVGVEGTSSEDLVGDEFEGILSWVLFCFFLRRREREESVGGGGGCEGGVGERGGGGRVWR